jgi:hypothetical protein
MILHIVSLIEIPRDDAMDDEERIKKKIAEIAQRPNNVTLSDIEWVVERLQGFHPCREPRKTRHGMLFHVGNLIFMVNCHNPGSKQVKPYSVRDFLEAMITLGWFEE